MHNKKTLIGLILGALVVLGLLLWYMGTHPAPVEAPGGPGASIPKSTEPEHVTSKGAYHTINLQYPATTPLARTAGVEADVVAVGIMHDFVASEAATFKKDNIDGLSKTDVEVMQLGGDRIYALEATYELHESPATISYVYQIYANTMGAHPNTYYKSFTFDKKTGQELMLADLFIPKASYLARLSAISRTKLPGIIASREEVPVSEVDTTYIQDGTKPEAAAFQTFYLDGANLVIVFPPYQVGPYVLGTIPLPIPLLSLSTLLVPEYK